jgi:hypothetical protein
MASVDTTVPVAASAGDGAKIVKVFVKGTDGTWST